MHKALKKQNIKGASNQTEKQITELNREFSKGGIQTTNKFFKVCSTSVAVGEIQIKTEISPHSSRKGVIGNK